MPAVEQEGAKSQYYTLPREEELDMVRERG